MVERVYAGRTSGLAVGSFVMGILAILLGWIPAIGWLISLVGIGLGIAALILININRNLIGRGLAITGLILSVIGLITGITLVTVIVNYIQNTLPTILPQT
jgi:hypothetical protein